MLERAGVAPAEDRLELAELPGLEAAGCVEPIAEAGELPGRHRLQHVDLRHRDLQDREDAAQCAHRVRGVAVLEPGLQVGQLVEELLEPQLVHLVDDDEEHLVVLVRARPLGTEHLVEGEVAAVGQGGVVIHVAITVRGSHDWMAPTARIL